MRPPELRLWYRSNGNESENMFKFGVGYEVSLIFLIYQHTPVLNMVPDI